MIKQALLSGIDMRDYREKIAEELEKETQSALQAFLDEEDTYLKLEQDINACDEQLESLENILYQFRSSINDVSSEIDELREESLVMNIKLENSQKVYQGLEVFSTGIAIDNAFVQFFNKGMPSDDNYLDILLSLEEKMSFAEKYEIHTKNITALKEVVPQFEAMRNLACQKIFKFFLEKIQKLKQSKVNVSELGFELIKYQYYYFFLEKYALQSAKEIQQSYITIMSKYYRDIFKNYISTLQKRIEKSELTKYHTIVEKKGKFLSGSSGSSGIRKSLQLGSKINLLNQPLSTTISTTNLDKNEKITFESFFRSINILLITFGKREYIFCQDFFGEKNSLQSGSEENSAHNNNINNTSSKSKQSSLNTSSLNVSLQPGLGGEYTQRHTIERIFKGVFEKSQKLILDQLNLYIKYSFDAVGILLIIRILQQLTEFLHSYQIQSLDVFYDGILMTLWMKFKEIITEHQMSLKVAPIDKLYVNERDTHTIAKRYSTIVSSIYLISQNENSTDKQMLDMTLGMMRNVFISFIEAVAGRLSTQVEGIVFTINTCDTILAELISHNLEIDDGHFFQELLKKRVNEFIQLKLKDGFGPLMDYVNRTEPRVVDASDKQGMERNLQMIDANQMEALVREFHSNWQSRVTHEQQEFQKQFKSLDTAMEIFKQYLTELLRYYQRFQQIIGKCFRNPPFKAMIVSGQSIMQFVKQLG